MYTQIPSNAADRFQLECTETAFEALFNKCYIEALSANLESASNPDIINECVNYSTSVLRDAGGIGLLTNAIESAKSYKIKSFLENFSNACVEAGVEMADSMTNASYASALEWSEDDTVDDTNINKFDGPASEDYDDDYDDDDDEDEDDDDEMDEEENEEYDTDILPEMPKEFKGKEINEVQLDTKITDKELNSLRNAADKTAIDDIAAIVAEKVAKVINAEKYNRYRIDEAKNKLKEAIIADPSNSADDAVTAESVMNNMLEVPLDKLESPVYTSLFTTLQRRAMEAIITFQNTNTPVAGVLEEITCNSTFDIFNKKELTFEEAAARAVEMAVITECVDECNTDRMASKATEFAIIIYTLLELMNTMSIHRGTPSEVKCIVNKERPFSPTNDVVNVVNNRFAPAIEKLKRGIRACETVADVESTIARVESLKSKLYQSKENGLGIEAVVFDQLDSIIEYGKQRLTALEKSANFANESAFIDTVSKVRESDVANMNAVARSLRGKNFDNVTFKCMEAANGHAAYSVEANIGNTRVYRTSVNLAGLESTDPDAYMNFIFKKSNMANIAPNNEKPEATVIYNGRNTVIS